VDSRAPIAPLRHRLAGIAAFFAGFGLVFGSGLALMELALRLADGDLLSTRSLRAIPPQAAITTVAHDPELGHVPSPGRYHYSDGTTRTVDVERLRSNGPDALRGEAYVLAIGGSSTFGDAVEDSDTWPAQLERRLGVRVANAGVSAYGIDQAVLRAEQLLEHHRPRLVVLAVDAESVERCELSHVARHKPWLAVDEGDLVLRGTPVPEAPRRVDASRDWLGRSFVLDALMRRVAPDWWSLERQRVDLPRGDEVAARLLLGLDGRLQARNAHLVLLTLVSGDRDLSRIAPLVGIARAAGIPVVDLAREIVYRADGAPDDARFFLAGGHPSGELNAWIAEQVLHTLAPDVAYSGSLSANQTGARPAN
jgi:hypothetical protein